MRASPLRAAYLFLALAMGQALCVLHDAEHALTTASDYQCFVCGHGGNHQPLLATAPALFAYAGTGFYSGPADPLAVAAVPVSRPPIRGPPLNLA